MASEKVKAGRLAKVTATTAATEAARKALRAETVKRDRAIRSALDANVTIRKVAEVAGLSPQQVLNIKSADPSGTRYNEKDGEA
jgi:hypothetical protein